ncbi:hypothetical protein [Neorhizobium sp. SOG26]|uniref:hypothetical protein n=1 Tax=Neorhizobium sp. SOG26 TaxID=2060726 RepID=UPI0019000EEC|nr:hypothetical protein [Neorhizobium sp. SOG26]
MPLPGRLGQGAAPAELFLQQEGVAEVDAVRGTKFDEITTGLELALQQHEIVLQDLRP